MKMRQDNIINRIGSDTEIGQSLDRALNEIALAFDRHFGGAFFLSARRYDIGQPSSVLKLIHASTSPAAACLQQYIRVLRDDADPHWRALAGGRQGWDPHLYHLASVPALMEMGNIYRRFAIAMDCWPWRLGHLLDEARSEAEQQSLAQELLDAQPCCLDDFTVAFRQGSHNVQDILSPANLRHFRDGFKIKKLQVSGWE